MWFQEHHEDVIETKKKKKRKRILCESRYKQRLEAGTGIVVDS